MELDMTHLEKALMTALLCLCPSEPGQYAQHLDPETEAAKRNSDAVTFNTFARACITAMCPNLFCGKGLFFLASTFITFN